LRSVCQKRLYEPSGIGERSVGPWTDEIRIRLQGGGGFVFDSERPINPTQTSIVHPTHEGFRLLEADRPVSTVGIVARASLADEQRQAGYQCSVSSCSAAMTMRLVEEARK
jgi:hypothetical protein